VKTDQNCQSNADQKEDCASRSTSCMKE